MTNPPNDPDRHNYGVPEYQGFLGSDDKLAY